MWRPGHDHFGTLFGLVFLDGDEVGEALERMTGRGLHAEHRATGVADELVDDPLLIVLGLVLESGEGADTDDVAVGTHDGDGLKQVFGLVAVHDDAALGLKFPRALVDIEYDHVHAEVEGSFLCAQTGAQTGVEKDHHQCLVAAEV